MLLFLSFYQSAAAEDIIRYASSITNKDVKEAYFIDLLTLALEETKPTFGHYTLESIPLEMGQGRSSIMVSHDKYINLTWRMTSTELEEQLQPIYVPLLRGIMGYRIFIIRQGEQHVFPSTIKRAELQKLHAGQGVEWQDNKILMHNNFTLVEGAAVNLLAMLKKNRFDYFPRALHEAWAEISTLSNEYAIEQNLLLKYPAPMYFFVNKKNTRLATRLTIGLNKLVDNGKLPALFANHPVTKNAIQLSNLPNRTIFSLENPFLSTRSQELFSIDKYWLSAQEY